MGNQNKPPLGVRPKYIYIEQRVTELCEAIARSNNHSKRVEWCSELGEWLRMLDGAIKVKIEDVCQHDYEVYSSFCQFRTLRCKKCKHEITEED